MSDPNDNEVDDALAYHPPQDDQNNNESDQRVDDSNKNDSSNENDNNTTAIVNNNEEQDAVVVETQKDFRGFSTSVSHLFLDPTTRRIDSCSVVCCGLLQSDRDRYLLTGVAPPSCLRRLWLHIVLPIVLFAVACFAAFQVSDVYLNQLITTLLVCSILAYAVMQCIKGRWKRVDVRKELLYRKHQLRNNDNNAGEEVAMIDLDTAENGVIGQPDNDGDDAYLQGQSMRDLNCAHAFLGCYTTDVRVDLAQPSPQDMCGWLAHRGYAQFCCGKLCGCHLQICGMCAIAQEARDLEEMVPSFQRRIDYVTMQPSLHYYANVLRLRDEDYPGDELTTHRNYLYKHAQTALSLLSHQLMQVWCFFMVVLLAAAIGLRFSLAHILVVMATFFHAWIFLYLVHWPLHKHDISLDATIKAFCSGFLLSTTLAVVWETMAGILLRIVMDILLAMSGIDVAQDDDGYGSLLWAAATRHRDYVQAYGQDHPVVYAFLLAIHAYGIAAFLEEVAKYLGYAMITDHPDFWSKPELESTLRAMMQSEEGEEDWHNPPLDVQAKSTRSKAAAITVAMVAVALGFACCENLVYVFVYNPNKLATEVFVLMVRVVFPVHVVCAAIQSLGVCENDLEKKKRSLGKGILLRAILLHGTFDYVFMLPFFSAMTSSILGFWVMMAGVVYYVRESHAQLQRYTQQDHQSTVDQSNLI